jgi:DNA-binding CsgD family transcriptional regulator
MVRQRTRAKPLAAPDLMILKRLATHTSAKEIAAEMGLSLSGVYKARARLAARLGTDNWEGFATAAGSYGLIQAVPTGPGSSRSAAQP